MRNYSFDPTQFKEQLRSILTEIDSKQEWDTDSLRQISSKFPKDGKGFFSKDQLVAGYEYLIQLGEFTRSDKMADRLKMKPMRTQSGVTTVTVLTKPFPCPGKCIFCPNDVKMPKSYLSDEPGAQRAERNNFDPYLQTYNRLLAIKNIGHDTDKVELIVLGGTWSFYPEQYQIWFVKRCFDAMNDFGVKDNRDLVKTENIFDEADKVPSTTEKGRRMSYNEIIDHVEKDSGEELISDKEMCDWDELYEAHRINETAISRCVGLVIETRPDYIDEAEIIKIRKLGATKIQIGIQSLNDHVMMQNLRGHGRSETENAIKLMRQGGFKVHAHWMPNLYSSTPELDIQDYKELWDSKISPDELKIYPTSIIANTELYDLFKKGKYKPYSHAELLHVLTEIMPTTPRYCRLTRIIRDIPSTDIVAGNKLTNFRQIAEEEMNKRGTPCQCIRCREIKLRQINFEDLEPEEIVFETPVSTEYFLSYKTKTDDKICGFLRLSLPKVKNFINELDGKAIIREVHVYGKVVGIGKESSGQSQHLGLGTKLINRSKEIATEKEFKDIAVISAIGTREYYRKRGFKDGELYMSQPLT